MKYLSSFTVLPCIGMFFLFATSFTLPQKAKSATIQQQKADFMKVKTIDSSQIFCHEYNFFAGDSLVYALEAYDSVSFIGKRPVLTIRKQRFSIKCTDVDTNGNGTFIMKELSFKGKQTLLDGEDIVRESPFLGREVSFVMDRYGSRTVYAPTRAELASIILHGVALGGTFQPVIFTDFGKAPCPFLHQSWSAQPAYGMPENAFPIPVVDEFYLLRTYSPIDTLGQMCNHISYSSTGQGNMEVTETKEPFRMISVLNGTGYVYQQQKWKMPLFSYKSQEVKFTYQNAKGQSKKGKHHLKCFYTLQFLKQDGKVVYNPQP